MDRSNAYGCLCAMEEFCGGTDYTVLAVKQAGFSWMVLFEKDDRQYVCAISEVCTFFTICDMAVWEGWQRLTKINTVEGLQMEQKMSASFTG